MDLTGAVLTDHALSQMAKRGIAEAAVRRLLAQPETILDVRPGRVAAQGMDGEKLLRAFVDVDRQPVEVVTVYRTSQIDKYRRQT
jgi:predicted CoA-binding protein